MSGEYIPVETEITPEMIEAGSEAIRKIDYDFWEMSSVEKMENVVTAVFRSMAQASRMAR